MSDPLSEPIAKALAARDGGAAMATSWWSYLPDARAVLSLPEVAGLRAKADAADRLLSIWGMTPGEEKLAAMRAAFDDLRALAGDPG